MLSYPSSWKAFQQQKKRCLRNTSKSVGRILNYTTSSKRSFHYDGFETNFERDLKKVIQMDSFTDKF